MKKEKDSVRDNSLSRANTQKPVDAVNEDMRSAKERERERERKKKERKKRERRKWFTGRSTHPKA